MTRLQTEPPRHHSTWIKYLTIWEAYYRGETFAAIGKRYGVTKARTWAICQRVDKVLGIPHGLKKNSPHRLARKLSKDAANLATRQRTTAIQACSEIAQPARDPRPKPAMTDIYTVIFTSNVQGDIESIPWVLSFGDLELAKNHVFEEARKHAADMEIDLIGQWEDREEHSSLIQDYGDGVVDTWLVTRTELVETNPSTELTPL